MANTKTATTPTKGAPSAKAAPTKGKGKAPTKGKGKTGVPANYGLRAAPTAIGKRRTAYAETAKVTVHKTALATNPKRMGSGAYNRFAQYQGLAKSKGNGKFTVADVLGKGVQPSDIKYNVTHGFITLKG